MPPTEQQPPRAASLVTQAYQQLRREIVHGRLAPGVKLRVEALGERYGIGASPIREALNRLTSEGLVQQQDQRGFQVSPVSMDELIELTRARRWINEIALRESIRSGDEVWEESVLLAFHRLSRMRTVKGANLTQEDILWDQLHQQFHASLVSACGSRHIVEFANRLFEQADRYRNLVVAESTQARNIPEEHRMLMEAVIGRRADEAVARLNDHIQSTTDLILPRLRGPANLPAATSSNSAQPPGAYCAEGSR